MIALGFVVARFGLFLTVISASQVPAAPIHRSHWPSSTLGIALVILGVGSILGALYNHRVFVRSLPAEDLPNLPIPWLTSLLALAVVAVGLLLAVYLVIT
jgi:putative membrane protein